MSISLHSGLLDMQYLIHTEWKYFTLLMFLENIPAKKKFLKDVMGYIPNESM